MWFLLFIGWAIIMPISMLMVTERLSSLGIYHPVKLGQGILGFLNCECDSKKYRNAECFYEKFMMILKANFILSILLLPAFLIVISDALVEESISFFETLCLSALLTLVSLITIRLLSNHSRFITGNAVKPSGKPIEEIAKERNEKTIGHFHTLVCTAWMILGIYVTADILENKTIPSIPPINISAYIFVFFVFVLAIPFITFIIEYFFLYSPPIIKTSSTTLEENEMMKEDGNAHADLSKDSSVNTNF
jgi:hypothetical protein